MQGAELPLDARLYPFVLALFAALCVGVAIFAARLKAESQPKAEMLPRAALPGAILGFIDLLWCIPNVKPILPEGMHAYLIPAAVAFAVLGWAYLDKLLARAAGGFLILMAHYLLKESFADARPGAALFAALCMAFGTLGIFVSGKPHLMRDLIRKVCESPKWRMATVATSCAIAASSLAMLSLHLLSGRGA